jgi:hypothetical protein
LSLGGGLWTEGYAYTVKKFLCCLDCQRAFHSRKRSKKEKPKSMKVKFGISNTKRLKGLGTAGIKWVPLQPSMHISGYLATMTQMTLEKTQKRT